MSVYKVGSDYYISRDKDSRWLTTFINPIVDTNANFILTDYIQSNPLKAQSSLSFDWDVNYGVMIQTLIQSTSVTGFTLKTDLKLITDVNPISVIQTGLDVDINYQTSVIAASLDINYQTSVIAASLMDAGNIDISIQYSSDIQTVSSVNFDLFVNYVHFLDTDISSKSNLISDFDLLDQVSLDGEIFSNSTISADLVKYVPVDYSVNMVSYTNIVGSMLVDSGVDYSANIVSSTNIVGSMLVDSGMDGNVKYLITSDPANGSTNYPGYAGYYDGLGSLIADVAVGGTIEADLVTNDLVYEIHYTDEFVGIANADVANTSDHDLSLVFLDAYKSETNNITVKPHPDVPQHNYTRENMVCVSCTSRHAALGLSKYDVVEDLFASASHSGSGSVGIRAARTYGTARRCIGVSNRTANSNLGIQTGTTGSRMYDCISTGLDANNDVEIYNTLGLHQETGVLDTISDFRVIDVDRRRPCTLQNVGALRALDDGRYATLAFGSSSGTVLQVTGGNLAATDNSLTADPVADPWPTPHIENVDDTLVFVAGSVSAAVSTGDFRLIADASNPLYNAGDGVNGQHIGPDEAYV
jgi:hypothetical protein